mmetsp:Transcript_22580/g.47082  ORF Transcript_22580/g.47082 Transcript_22580/m.47082 type:complete len:205 (+) Transcript_22580:2080-2694(+)
MILFHLLSILFHFLLRPSLIWTLLLGSKRLPPCRNQFGHGLKEVEGLRSRSSTVLAFLREESLSHFNNLLTTFGLHKFFPERLEIQVVRRHWPRWHVSRSLFTSSLGRRIYRSRRRSSSRWCGGYRSRSTTTRTSSRRGRRQRRIGSLPVRCYRHSRLGVTLKVASFIITRQRGGQPRCSHALVLFRFSCRRIIVRNGGVVLLF